MALSGLKVRETDPEAPKLEDIPVVKTEVSSFPLTQGRFISQDSWAKRFGAWGSLFVTAIIFSLLAIGLVFSAILTDPPTSFSNLMETVKNLAMIAAGFWLGSSNSSQKKDDTIAEGTAALAVSTPPVVKPQG